MEIPKLTIFTPTYNRSYILPALYESLKKQDSHDFVWLIVDDGSTDNTKQLVSQWSSEGDINIHYYYQNNAGKMAAHNYAVKKCSTELFFCVDSDDYLINNAVTKILTLWNNTRFKETLSGIVAYRKMIGLKNEEHSCFGTSKNRAKLRDCLHNYFGETALIFRTNILKKYEFPLIPGEKFISEMYIYNKIDDFYDMLVVKEDFVACQYQKDGYTQNLHKVIAQNPKGFILFFSDMFNRSHSFKEKMVLAIQVWACSLIAKYSITTILKSFHWNCFTLLLLPFGYVYLRCKLIKFLK